MFTGRKLEKCKENFSEVLSELEDPNIPKIKLTRDRGNWKIIPLNNEGKLFSIKEGSVTFKEIFIYLRRQLPDFSRRTEF